MTARTTASIALLLCLLASVSARADQAAPNPPGQSPPAQKPAAPAPGPAEQPPPAAGASSEQPPQAEGYTYNPEGRRDPFVSLTQRGTDLRGPLNRPEGIAGLIIAEITVKGIDTKPRYLAKDKMLVLGPPKVFDESNVDQFKF